MQIPSKRIIETLPSATVLLADRVFDMQRKGIEINDFSAGRAL